MKNVILNVLDNIKISEDIYLLKLTGDLKEIKNPGEFVNLRVEKFYLRRPISVFDFNENEVDLLYKIVGQGTKAMKQIKSGDEVEVLVGLGNGFLDLNYKNPLLIAGGIGIAPMFNLAKKINELGVKPTLIYGGQSKKDIVLIEEFEKITNLIITTDDGSLGYKGNPVTYLKNNEIKYDKYYACGPLIMLKFLKEFDDNGYLSLEARMGCGFGACMGCSIKTTKGFKRVCKEGPIFEASEVIFDE